MLLRERLLQGLDLRHTFLRCHHVSRENRRQKHGGEINPDSTKTGHSQDAETTPFGLRPGKDAADAGEEIAFPGGGQQGGVDPEFLETGERLRVGARVAAPAHGLVIASQFTLQPDLPAHGPDGRVIEKHRLHYAL